MGERVGSGPGSSTCNGHRPHPPPHHGRKLVRAVHTGTDIEDSLREGDRVAGWGVFFFLLFTLDIFLYLRSVPIIWPAHGERGLHLPGRRRS